MTKRVRDPPRGVKVEEKKNSTRSSFLEAFEKKSSHRQYESESETADVVSILKLSFQGVNSKMDCLPTRYHPVVLATLTPRGGVEGEFLRSLTWLSVF